MGTWVVELAVKLDLSHAGDLIQGLFSMTWPWLMTGTPPSLCFCDFSFPPPAPSTLQGYLSNVSFVRTWAQRVQLKPLRSVSPVKTSVFRLSQKSPWVSRVMYLSYSRTFLSTTKRWWGGECKEPLFDLTCGLKLLYCFGCSIYFLS